jgi:hypothetical protein
MANAKAGVNKPELLPKEFTTVIDVAGFLSSGQVIRTSNLVYRLTVWRFRTISTFNYFRKC